LSRHLPMSGYEDGRIASSLQKAFIENDEERGEGGVKSPV